MSALHPQQGDVGWFFYVTVLGKLSLLWCHMEEGRRGEGRGGSRASVLGEELPGWTALTRGLGDEEETPTLLTWQPKSVSESPNPSSAGPLKQELPGALQAVIWEGNPMGAAPCVGQEWAGMVRGAQGWSGMVRDGQEWSGVLRDGQWGPDVVRGG